MPSGDAEALFQELLLSAPWARRMLQLHGKEVEMPRDIAWYGATKAQGHYAADVQPWPPYLMRAKAWVEKMTGFTYNGCLCNLYRDGYNSVAWHSDREAFGGAVTSLSLGAMRIFKIRDKQDHRIAVDIPLLPGSLLLMRPGCQERTEHCVPKTSKEVGPRINLTFRQVRS
ncbi:MAG: alpha-ketoglutarate-dependent dioxygenase AlkB family protein [Flavobacteriales bacterium]